MMRIYFKRGGKLMSRLVPKTPARELVSRLDTISNWQAKSIYFILIGGEPIRRLETAVDITPNINYLQDLAKGKVNIKYGAGWKTEIKKWVALNKDDPSMEPLIQEALRILKHYSQHRTLLRRLEVLYKTMKAMDFNVKLPRGVTNLESYQLLVIINRLENTYYPYIMLQTIQAEEAKALAKEARIKAKKADKKTSNKKDKKTKTKGSDKKSSSDNKGTKTARAESGAFRGNTPKNQSSSKAKTHHTKSKSKKSKK